MIIRHEWDQHLGVLPPKPHPIGPARRVGERVLTVYGTGVVVRWHDQEERETAAAVAAAAAAAAAAVADIVLPAASGAGTGAAGKNDEGASTAAGVVAASVSADASSSSSPPSSLSALTDGAAAGSNVSELGGASGDAAAAAAAAATTRMAFGDAVSSGEELAMLDDDGRSPSSALRLRSILSSPGPTNGMDLPVQEAGTLAFGPDAMYTYVPPVSPTLLELEGRSSSSSSSSIDGNTAAAAAAAAVNAERSALTKKDMMQSVPTVSSIGSFGGIHATAPLLNSRRSDGEPPAASLDPTATIYNRLLPSASDLAASSLPSISGGATSPFFPISKADPSVSTSGLASGSGSGSGSSSSSSSSSSAGTKKKKKKKMSSPRDVSAATATAKSGTLSATSSPGRASVVVSPALTPSSPLLFSSNAQGHVRARRKSRGESLHLETLPESALDVVDDLHWEVNCFWQV